MEEIGPINVIAQQIIKSVTSLPEMRSNTLEEVKTIYNELLASNDGDVIDLFASFIRLLRGEDYLQAGLQPDNRYHGYWGDILGLIAKEAEFINKLDPITLGVYALLNADYWDIAKLVIESRKDILLSDQVGQGFEWITKEKDLDLNMQLKLKRSRALLARCREIGVEQAFNEFISSPENPMMTPELLHELSLLKTEEDFREFYEERPEVFYMQEKTIQQDKNYKQKHAIPDRDELGILLLELSTLTHIRKISRRLEVYRSAINLVNTDEQPGLWAGLNAELAYYLCNYPVENREESFETAIQLYQLALNTFIQLHDQESVVKTYTNLSDTLLKRIKGDHQENIENAISYCNKGLDVSQSLPNSFNKGLLLLNTAVALLESENGSKHENTENAIKYLMRALDMIECEEWPIEWAKTHLSLANAFEKRMADSREESIEESIKHSLLALSIFEDNKKIEEVTSLHFKLGTLYSQRLMGNEGENIEIAIGYLKSVLSHKQDVNVPIGITHSLLGNLYTTRSAGDQKENLNEAARHIKTSLDIFGGNINPSIFGNLQFALSGIYFELFNKLGIDNGNLEESISHSLLAIRAFENDGRLNDLAILHSRLGILYHQRQQGVISENEENAIFHLDAAINCSKETEFQWGFFHYQLGIMLLDRATGNKMENLNQAISHLNIASEYFDKETDPETWGTIQFELAMAYSKLERNPALNVERAIVHYQESLMVFTKDSHPEKWVTIMEGLGLRFLYRTFGSRVENVDKAINCFLSATDVVDREEYPELWGNFNNLLGIAYRNRVNGDQNKNIEQSILRFIFGIEACPIEKYPERWSDIQNNLGNSYRRRVIGGESENIEAAIKHFDLALKVRTRAHLPQKWAQTNMNLGNAYNERIIGNRKENLDIAQSHCNSALEVITKENDPELWATLHNTLGNIYASIGSFDVSFLLMAVAHYCLALEIRDPQTAPLDYARTQMSLGRVYYSISKNNSNKELRKAIHCFQNALTIFTPEEHPLNCRGVARILGKIYAHKKQWKKSAQYYQQAIQADQILYQGALLHVSKNIELTIASGLYSEAGYVYVKAGEPYEALNILEKGRARQMLEVLEKTRKDLERLRDTDNAALFDRYRAASKSFTAQIVQSEKDIYVEETYNYIELENASRQMRAIIDEINQVAGYENFMKSPSVENIKNIAGSIPLVYIAVSDEGGLALLVNQNDVTAICLDHVSAKELNEKLIGIDPTPYSLGGYLGTYGAWRSNPDNETICKNWHSSLNETLVWLGKTILDPVLNALNGATRAVLIPGGPLGLLPLHAAILPPASNLKSQTSEFAIDRCMFTYAPSAQALHHAQLSKNHPVETLFAVGNPDERQQLPFTESEIQIASGYFSSQKSTVLLNKQATKEAVQNSIINNNVLHFATHGMANMKESKESYLRLADGDLTLSELQNLNLSNARLAILSACETGMLDIKIPDEVVSLSSSFMQAGVPGVISSLWSVSDMSTAMLMACFYDFWRIKGISAPESLCQAQIWLRDSTIVQKKELIKNVAQRKTSGVDTKIAQSFYVYLSLCESNMVNFESPYYWAAFTYTGV